MAYATMTVYFYSLCVTFGVFLLTLRSVQYAFTYYTQRSACFYLLCAAFSVLLLTIRCVQCVFTYYAQCSVYFYLLCAVFSVLLLIMHSVKCLFIFFTIVPFAKETAYGSPAPSPPCDRKISPTCAKKNPGTFGTGIFKYFLKD